MIPKLRALASISLLGMGLSLSPSLAQAGTARILSPAELLEHRASFVVIDARPDKLVRVSRIPNSIQMNWEEWTLEKPGLVSKILGNPENWGLPAEANEKLEKKLRGLGLSNSAGAPEIVVVGSPAGWGEEGRIAWNLLYWGAEKVALLEGGFPAWKGPIETGKLKKAAKSGDFTLKVDPSRLAVLEDIQHSVHGQSPRTLLDVREPDEYYGSKKMPGQSRGGHIPGAVFIPFRALFADNGTYISAESLKKRLPPALTSPITYCTGGVRSALLALLIEARLGTRTASYAGSLWEYSSHADLPLVSVSRVTPTPTQ